MSDVHAAPEAAGEAMPALTPAETHTPSDLGRMFGQLRRQKEPESAPEVAAPEETEIPAQAENAAPVEEQPSGETTETTDPVEVPTIEPPRSLTKEQKEAFKLLPPEVQRNYADLERTREVEFRRGQNEAAELRKAAEAERKIAEQARQQYEAQLPVLMQTLQDAQAGAFSDVRTVDDVTRLASEDPFRYLQWQAHQTKVQAVQAEMMKAEQRQQHERQNNLSKFQREQTEKLAEHVPDIKDPEKFRELTKKAIDHLKSFDLSEQDLGGYSAQGDTPFIHTAAFQRILLNSLRWDEAQKAKTTVAAKPVPPVQRPGVAPPRGAGNAEVIKNLTAKLEQSRTPRALADVIGAMRKGT